MDCFKASIPILKALCDETRLHILSMLSHQEMSACEINKAFRCTQPTISYHMRLLVDTRLVLARREGCLMIYSANPAVWPSVQALLKVLCEVERQKQKENQLTNEGVQA